jgi:hypothetical protein
MPRRYTWIDRPGSRTSWPAGATGSRLAGSGPPRLSHGLTGLNAARSGIAAGSVPVVCLPAAAVTRRRGHRVAVMLCPASWSRPAGGSPVRVSTGAPGSRPRFVIERWRAERGVKSLCGGSKYAGRSIKRALQPRQANSGGAEPLMSRRRPRPAGPGPGSACRVLPGYGGRQVCMVWAGTGEARLPGLRRAKTAGMSRW